MTRIGASGAVALGHDDGPRPPAPSDASEVFEADWHVYRQLVDNNYLFHREAYATLRRRVLRSWKGQYRILDLACGDASSMTSALHRTPVRSYFGVDLSVEALSLAATNLARLKCSVELRRADFAEAVRSWSRPVDLVWIGLSLHHFRTSEKLDIIRAIGRILKPDGLLVIYENTAREDESRDGWLRRWDDQRPVWSALSDAAWRRITGHVHACDYPETPSVWRKLGRDAGLSEATELWRTPTDLFRMYAFVAGKSNL